MLDLGHGRHLTPEGGGHHDGVDVDRADHFAGIYHAVVNGKKALWTSIGLLFVAGIVVAAVLGTRGGGGVETTAVPDAPPPPPAVSFDASPPAIDAPPAPIDAAPPPDATAPADAPAPAEAPLPEPPPPPPPEPPPSADIVVDEPRVVGDVDPQPIIDALEALRPQLESCRPRSRETARVKVQFHVGLGGLRLAAPAADNTGDTSVARCIANRVKSAKPVWKADESGIIIVEATVPPRP
jgi:hypothetical protein